MLDGAGNQRQVLIPRRNGGNSKHLLTDCYALICTKYLPVLTTFPDPSLNEGYRVVWSAATEKIHCLLTDRYLRLYLLKYRLIICAKSAWIGVWTMLERVVIKSLPIYPTSIYESLKLFKKFQGIRKKYIKYHRTLFVITLTRNTHSL